MLSSKMINRVGSITGILVALEIVCLFLNFGSVISQESNIVSETEVLELAEKFIQKNQDKVAFLVSARIGEPKLLYDENNKPLQWRVSILKGNKRLGFFNVLAFRASNGVLPTWFYGPGDRKNWGLEKKEVTTGGIKLLPTDEAAKKLDATFPKAKINEPQKHEEKGGVSSNEYISTTQENNLQKPNLSFYTPSGWDDGIVVSSVPGTHTHEETVSSPFYIDYAYANYSDYKAVGYIENQIYVSDDIVGYGHRTDLDPWHYSYLEDTEASVTATGWHTVAVVLDHLDNIDESDENDNYYEVYVYVENGPVPEPELVESFTCSDYDNPYGTQTTTFYTTDDYAAEFTKWDTRNCTRTWQGRVDFWDPYGEIYYQGNADLEPGHASIWFIVWMYISGYGAENMPGWWRALVNVEGAWRASDDFEIIQPTPHFPELINHWTYSVYDDPWGSKETVFSTEDDYVYQFTEWNTVGCDQTYMVSINFYKGGTWIHGASGDAPPGRSSWILKGSMPIKGAYAGSHPGTDWHVDMIGPEGFIAQNDFTIEQPIPEDITVTSPNGGEVWQVGTSHTITWTSQNTSGNVEIEYSTNGGSSWSTITSSTSDDGSFSWTIPNTPSTNCYVRITDVDGTPSDKSDGPFTIRREERITVTSPNGGEVWQVGTSHNITWTSSGTSGNVKIEYSNNSGISWTTVIASTSDDGSHSWTIPNTPSTNCYVRITDVDGSPSDMSDGPFTIRVGENIVVTSPNGGEVWQVGTSHNITWTSSGTSGNVKIEYSNNSGISWTTVIASTADDGSHSWTVPNTPSTNCYVRISDVDGSPSDMSNGPFTIAIGENITVTSPNGGEIWQAGTSQNITWTSSGTSGNMKIEYSTNNGASWSIIVASTPDDGSHSWMVPNTPSTNCYVRIIDVDGSPSDMSNGPFTITSGPDWTVPITISGGGNTFIRTFGGDADAVSGLDAFDVSAAPPGMTYYAYFEISVFPNYLDTDIRGWVSPYKTDIDWTLKIVHTQGITSTLSWNMANIPSGSDIGTFSLVGPGLNVNMRSQGSAQVNGDATLIIQYRSGITMTYNFPQQGWFLISLPLTPANNSLSILFPTAMAAFAYDPISGSYNSVTTLVPKKGYWLLIPSATSSTITGVPLTSYTEHYNMGWHLIGTVVGTTNFTDPIDDPNGAVIAAYGWNPGTSTYSQVYPPGTGVLNEKEGYWLAVSKSCDLTIGGSALSKDVVAPEVDVETFYQRFGSQPPVPPMVADRSLASLVSTETVSSRTYPNPFNLETVIEYWLPQEGFTKLHIYNSMGQRIRTLIEAQQSQGIHQAVWDGRNDNGEIVTNGIYFYRIMTQEFVETQKVLLLK